ncbi:EAL domain-containing protein [Sphaerochaeta globosa]|uniref:Diguanylate cyclase/phosphodiesterase with PAS/PAC sensor(S) n=1 Tax=Sphaerochaeta globosa (strain ATCC BAA-1886 / DSM 22777 / Buddy) TaxID=158189 RepID=F0RW05_SPHGB|nr:EAL domain-containing protein [Sphaerochaeta globosa]ADY13291.1 diguanylate cyclase/phosphodiesterase with PAS/PAC sensor(s) [Sphaerochaeta globosa str. Buddy]
MKEVQRKVNEAGAFLSINNLPGGVGVYELGDTIRATYLSRGLAKLLGYTSAEFHTYTDLHLLNAVHPQDRKRISSLFSRIKKSHREIDVEFRINTEEEHWIRLLGRFARFHGQFPVYYFVASDTSEAHQSSVLLEQQNTRLQFAFSHSTLEMWEYHIAQERVTTLSRTILGGHQPINTPNPVAYLLKQGYIHPSFEETLKQDFEDLNQGSAPDSIVKIKDKDGMYRYLRYSYSFLKDNEGHRGSAIGVFQDVHDEIETRLQVLGKNKAFFAAFNLETGRPVLADSATRKIMKGQTNLYEVFEQVLKTSVEPSYFHLFCDIADSQKLQAFFTSGRKELSIEARMQHPFYREKGYPWVRFNLSISTSTSQTIGYIAIQDIDADKIRQQLLIERSQRDSLTGLFNRISLEEMIQDILKNQESLGGFYLIDIDSFKQINDTYGHERGDWVLKQIAEELQAHFPGETIIGRLGGDEFVAYVPDCQTQSLAFSLGASFCKKPTLEIPCTCSVGLCMKEGEFLSFEQLYQNADLALYRAKELGKNQCVLYDPSMDAAKTYSWTNHEWILDNLPDTIALSDAATCEMLFLNKAGRYRYAPLGGYLGKSCFEVLYGRQDVCPSCKTHALNYDSYQLWVSNTDDGTSVLHKEKLVMFHDRPAKLTVLVNQIKQAEVISSLAFQGLKPEKNNLSTYFASLHYGGESWDYDVQLDLLTVMRVEGNQPKHYQFSAFLKQGEFVSCMHEKDTLYLRDALRAKFVQGDSNPFIVRLKKRADSDTYVSCLLTCTYSTDETGKVIRLGGQIIEFAEYGFACRKNLMPSILSEMSIPLLVFSFDVKPIFIFCNKQLQQKLEMDESTLKNNPFAWLDEQDQTQFLQYLQGMVQKNQGSGSFVFKDVQNRYFNLSCHFGPVYGKEQVVTVAVQDVSRERHLLALNQRMQNYVDQALQGIAVFQFKSDALQVQYINGTLAQFLDFERGTLLELLHGNALLLFHPEDSSLLLRNVEQMCMSGHYGSLRLRLITKNQTVFWSKVTVRQVGVVGCGQPFSLLFDDINEIMDNQKEKEQTLNQLYYALGHNLLTGLYTRQRFYEETRALLDEQRNNAFVMVYWNIERFSIINELLGFETGNQVLQLFAKSLRNFIKDAGVYAHLESDHFAACLPKEVCDLDKLGKAIEVDAISQSIGYTVTVVFGLYAIEDRSMPVSQLLDRAHSAAKSTRHNYHKSYAFYNPAFRSDTFNEQDVLNEMHQALEAGQFTFYLQPIYDVQKEHIISAEALVRWVHPKRGIIAPIQFIPVFERYGFITTLDLYLLDAICAFLASCLTNGEAVVPISLNLSRIDLSNRQIVQRIKNTVEKYHLDHHLIHLEVTESAYIDNPDQMCQVVKELQECGFIILMDDFGTGYSSMNMLYSLPLDILKIDRSFIQALEGSIRSRHIIASLITLGKNLDFPVIAEGVETTDQRDCLKDLGCNLIQGFLYSKPVAQTDFRHLLARG